MDRAHDIPKELEDAFIKVTFEEEDNAPRTGSPTHAVYKDPFSTPWSKQSSATWADKSTYGAFELKKLYPGHSVVMSTDYGINLLGFPSAAFRAMVPDELITQVQFQPFARRLGQVPGVLVDGIRFGSFHVSWGAHDFILYITRYPQFTNEYTKMYLVHDGPEEHSRALLTAAGAWNTQLHQEVLVFNQGFWRKDTALWQEIQKAKWSEVVLKEHFKTSLKKDIFGFFDSEELYKGLAIPWKRGIIMHGPPGNGKTISIKAIMKDCDALGYVPLYVKSFKSYMGEEGSMAAVFSKAREMAPCVVVLEDLDSLINDQNRSFFLNQIDGLEGNDGLLVIGTTNHLDKLDPALSTRPSRFDRKFPFDDPDEEERTAYARFWQEKLKSNESIDFPDDLVSQVAQATDGFSFAYLKEAFVSALVLLAGYEDGENPAFSVVLLSQIKTLRDQLKKQPKNVEQERSVFATSTTSSGWRAPERRPFVGSEGILPGRLGLKGRFWSTGEENVGMPGGLPAMSASPRAGPEVNDGRTPVVLSSLGRSFF